MKIFFVFALFVLTGCVTDQYVSEKNMCEHKPTWVEYAQCLNRIGAIHYSDDPLEREMIAYQNFLIEKVQNKQMTPAEAEYLRQQKWNQAKQQHSTPNYYSGSSNLNTTIQQNNNLMMEAIKNNQKNSAMPSEPLFKSPTSTDCNPNGYGGITCTTY